MLLRILNTVAVVQSLDVRVSATCQLKNNQAERVSLAADLEHTQLHYTQRYSIT